MDFFPLCASTSVASRRRYPFCLCALLFSKKNDPMEVRNEPEFLPLSFSPAYHESSFARWLELSHFDRRRDSYRERIE